MTQHNLFVDEAPEPTQEIIWNTHPPKNPAPWPDPTDEMLESDEFAAVWATIKTWDISVPEVYGDTYCGATGNHVRAILDALKYHLRPTHTYTIPTNQGE